MPDDAGKKAFTLRRWSQRKLAAARGDDARGADDRMPAAPRADDRLRTSAPVDAMTAPACAPQGAGATILSSRGIGAANARGIGSSRGAAPGAVQTAAPGTRATVSAPGPEALPLPPLESLTIDSDFSPFMQPGVDEELKRSALRKLLRHPQFNVMDGLDVYIDDYSKPSPLEPELVRTLAQARYLFNPPKTRVTEAGIVEDVPDEPLIAHDTAAGHGEAPTALPEAGAADVLPTPVHEAGADGSACAAPAAAEAQPRATTPPGVLHESKSE